MKKFLLTCVVASCAFLAQAVVLNWTTPEGTWGSSVVSGALVYAADASGVTDANVIDFITNTSTTVTGLTNVTVPGEQSSWKFTESGIYNYVSVTEGGKKTEGTGTYFLVLFDADNAHYAIAQFGAKDTASAWTDEVSQILPGGIQAITPTFKGTLVPEPTVLALLALGVAGLALRRRA